MACYNDSAFFWKDVSETLNDLVSKITCISSKWPMVTSVCIAIPIMSICEHSIEESITCLLMTRIRVNISVIFPTFALVVCSTHVCNIIRLTVYVSSVCDPMWSTLWQFKCTKKSVIIMLCHIVSWTFIKCINYVKFTSFTGPIYIGISGLATSYPWDV